MSSPETNFLDARPKLYRKIAQSFAEQAFVESPQANKFMYDLRAGGVFIFPMQYNASQTVDILSAALKAQKGMDPVVVSLSVIDFDQDDPNQRARTFGVLSKHAVHRPVILFDTTPRLSGRNETTAHFYKNCKEFLHAVQTSIWEKAANSMETQGRKSLDAVIFISHNDLVIDPEDYGKITSYPYSEPDTFNAILEGYDESQIALLLANHLPPTIE